MHEISLQNEDSFDLVKKAKKNMSDSRLKEGPVREARESPVYVFLTAIKML